ncbi:MAG: PD-(D/E)XK nuclease family protein, partial [Gammaproteobacteria bacterium]|nr:PD-(D/E)XK nuclease family protein [Gammaproteobacteria bacterium]
DYQVTGLPTAVEGAGGASEEPVDSDAVEYDWAGRSARLIGIVAHSVLRQISEEGLQRWPLARARRAAAQWRQRLQGMGLLGADLELATEAVVESVRRTLADPRGQWLLDNEHAMARSEYPLTGVIDGALVNVVLDRTFVDDNAHRWIVDYKTGAHRGGGLDEFLDREQQRYRDQLERYAHLMYALDPRPTRLALYFPAIGAWREWTWHEDASKRDNNTAQGQ